MACQDLENNMRQIALTIPGNVSVAPVAGMPDGNVFNHLVPNLLTLVFVGATVIALLLVIVGGIKWISSGGEKEKLEGARKTIIYALIGLVIIFSSYFIINTVDNFFGVTFFTQPK